MVMSKVEKAQLQTLEEQLVACRVTNETLVSKIEEWEVYCKTVTDTSLQLKKDKEALSKDLDKTKAEMFELTRQVASLQGYVDRFHYEERKMYIAANPVFEHTTPRELPVGGTQWHESPHTMKREMTDGSIYGTVSRQQEPTVPWYLR